MISWFSGKKEEKVDHSPGKKIEQIIQLVTHQLTILISRELGEHVTVPEDIVSNLKEQVQDIIKDQSSDATKLLENNLVNLKEKYNYIVTSLEQTKIGIREFHAGIGNSIENFVTVLAQTLQSRELLVPIKDIKKGIMESSGDTVEKYLNLLGKLYLHEYSKVQESSSQAESDMKLKKSLESEIVLLREQKKQTEKKVQEIETDKMNTIKALNKKEEALMAKLKLSEETLATTLLDLRQSRKKIEQLQINTKLLVQEEQENKVNKESKEQRYLQSIKKLNQEKMEAEDRYKQLQIQINRIKNQQSQTIAKANQTLMSQLETVKNRGSLLQHQVQRLNKQLTLSQEQKQEFVDKNVVRGMLEVYMDQGKEWNIRNQIQKQLTLLLNIKQKQPPTQQQTKGWFSWL